MPKSDLTQDEVLALLMPDYEAGTLQWRSLQKASIGKGGQAGTLLQTGYRIVRINKRNYFAHRLIWLCKHGGWPAGDIDHINGIKSDNRLVNLRDVSRTRNKENIRKANANSASGLLGAHKFKDRWSSHIGVNGKKFHLGYFDTAQEAHEAYLAYKRVHHIGNTL